VKAPFLFQGTQGGLTLDDKFLGIRTDLGKQMPNNNAARQLDKGTTSTTDSLNFLTLFYMGSQIIFQGLLKHLIGTLLCM